MTFRLKSFFPYPCVSTAFRKLLPSKGHKKVALQLQNYGGGVNRVSVSWFTDACEGLFGIRYVLHALLSKTCA